MKNFTMIDEDFICENCHKEVKALGEEAKVAIRNVRRDGIDDAKKLKANGELTEDELKGAEEKIQKITDKYTDKVEKMVSDKEKEVMEV